MTSRVRLTHQAENDVLDIFFRVADEGIEIYRVLHGARRLEDLL